MKYNSVIDKFKSLSFPNGFILWLSDYLSNRACAVKIRNSLSHSFEVKRGIPQGSVLGPSIFSIFMADLSATKDSVEVVKYADDLNIIVPLPLRSPAAIQKDINTEMHNINQWCKINSMQLNLQKSNTLIICSKRHEH